MARWDGRLTARRRGLIGHCLTTYRLVLLRHQLEVARRGGGCSEGLAASDGPPGSSEHSH